MIVIRAEGDMIFETCMFNEYAEQVEERDFGPSPKTASISSSGTPFVSGYTKGNMRVSSDHWIETRHSRKYTAGSSRYLDINL